jgi:hypothetical protein
MRAPSIVPRDSERDTTSSWTTSRGRLGCAWRETDAESADRVTLNRSEEERPATRTNAPERMPYPHLF